MKAQPAAAVQLRNQLFLSNPKRSARLSQRQTPLRSPLCRELGFPGKLKESCSRACRTRGCMIPPCATAGTSHVAPCDDNATSGA